MGPAFTRKYNTLLVAGTTGIRIPIIKRAVVDFAVGADWTPAAGDVKIAIGSSAPANVTNLPTATASGNGAYWEFILTAAELSATQVIVTVVDSATKAIEDTAFLVETYGNASAMYQADLSTLPASAVSIADTLLDRDMSVGSDSGSPSVRTVRQALRVLRNKVSSSAGTMTVTKEDDSTSSWTAALTTDVTALPIVTIDPA